ncbi:MAG: hypothetical protein NTZ74_06265 [Chloroflexi bacterium]|nr:hypothetical protein [Chloroflexota bacterium]
MFNSDTEILFPIKAIPYLLDIRGDEWQSLVSKITSSEDNLCAKIAFTALVVKLAGCVGCNADSFRAMRGCVQCSRLIIKRFKGSDSDLLNNYQECLNEVNTYLLKREQKI